MHQLFAIVALTQAVFQEVPAPSRMLEPPLNERREQYARTLHEKCMSRAGVQIVLASWEARQLAGPNHSKKTQATARELAEAALSDPLQTDRLERAIIADADQQTAFQRDFARDQVAILKQLKGDDRTIYARMTTPAQPLTPPKRCGAR